MTRALVPAVKLSSLTINYLIAPFRACSENGTKRKNKTCTQLTTVYIIQKTEVNQGESDVTRFDVRLSS